jgi:hypothetical protein
VRASLEVIELRILNAMLALQTPVRGIPGGRVPRSAGGWGWRPRLAQLRLLSSAAQRAEWDGRFAHALRRLSDAKATSLRIRGNRTTGDPVTGVLEQRQRAATESFADFLAVTWRLPHAETGDLSELIRRLSAQRGPAAAKAQEVLGHLETLLLEGRATYYRIDLRAWVTGGRARQVLPFQGTVKSLTALEAARHALEELPWSVEDLHRLGAPLASLAQHVGRRLEETLKPRIQNALQEAELATESSAGHLTMRRPTDALAELVRRRGHLKFTDVRDLLNRDTLSLPDWKPAELWQGDRLGRFDRAASRRLPGVYQRGEFYVKGLQRLGAPVSGTRTGRSLSRVLLLPGLVAWALLQVSALLWGLFVPAGERPHLTGVGSKASFAMRSSTGSFAARSVSSPARSESPCGSGSRSRIERSRPPKASSQASAAASDSSGRVSITSFSTHRPFAAMPLASARHSLTSCSRSACSFAWTGKDAKVRKPAAAATGTAS